MDSKLLDILNPHRRRSEELRRKIEDYGEASRYAAEAGNMELVKSLQAEVRDTFLKLLVASVIDGMFWLIPHAIVLAILSRSLCGVDLPWGLNEVNVPYLYIAGVVTYYLTRWLRRRSAARVQSSKE